MNHKSFLGAHSWRQGYQDEAYRALVCRVFLQGSAQPAPDAKDSTGEESGHGEAGEKEAVGGLGPGEAPLGGLENDLQGQRRRYQ